MFFLVQRDVTMNGESYAAGEVLPAHDVPPVVQQHLERGEARYASLLTLLTDEQAFALRARKTAEQGARKVDGWWISPPWADWAGLRTPEILARLREADPEKIAQAAQYERGAEQPRTRIVTFGSQDPAPNVNGVHPSELRFAALNPNDAEGIAELETRIAELEANRRGDP
jgi:hypothetical protein